ncbi:MAG TPA: hypothetical protein VGM12_29825 [Trebonia sp.]|jgi:hypothetical protein
MPWVVRDAVDEINRAAGRRWQGLDRVAEALVRQVHAVLDARGVDTTLLHHAQLNPLSAPSWSRMGYRPLSTGWEVRPAASLR